MKSSAIFQSWFNIKLTNKKIENVFKDDMLEKGKIGRASCRERV